ncbi:MAG TPA: electron-transfer flavoprotein:ubiquinone oxidoreductase [Longimicrobiaceae bacterium]|jgi:electron-transferring-flavoprotein dehydrogenase|nr:electron-transfer flavoprotein:ubiquinone oxidoreductase [Longimicrobiaceae bacterium]
MAESARGVVVPARHQAELPRDRMILAEAPDTEAIEMDVVFAGAGPAGLAGAIELARLCKKDGESGGSMGELQIAVLDKASSLGEHNLSGAVINPRAFKELFPELEESDFPFRQKVDKETVALLTETGSYRIPTPPPMHNQGNYTASISEVVRWLGEKAEGLGVNVLPGFPVDSLLVDGDRVRGVRTVPSGLDRGGQPGGRYEAPTDVTAQVTVLAEGTRGALTQAYRSWRGIESANPQIYALGVKEVWEVKEPLDRIVHTLGWPLPRDAFGGSFMYPLGGNLVALGLVVGLDYRQTTLDVHQLLQRMKLHPFFRKHLEGGEMVEWGAKTIPEGGYYSLPARRVGHGLMMVGDAAGFVDVPSLKGIHYAMQSGIYAARAAFAAIKGGDVSSEALAEYDRMIDHSYVVEDMYRTRNMRLAFKDGFFVGGVKAGLMTLTGGRVPGGQIDMHPDAVVPRRVTPEAPFVPDGKLTFSKVDAVFKSGNQTRDDIPSHLIVGQDVSAEVATLYEHLCPAGVYERQGDKLVVNAPNCIDCKATDVIGPRWTPREGGSGPAYKQM